MEKDKPGVNWFTKHLLASSSVHLLGATNLALSFLVANIKFQPQFCDCPYMKCTGVLLALRTETFLLRVLRKRNYRMKVIKVLHMVPTEYIMGLLLQLQIGQEFCRSNSQVQFG